jgi:hypothetical protein
LVEKLLDAYPSEILIKEKSKYEGISVPIKKHNENNKSKVPLKVTLVLMKLQLK